MRYLIPFISLIFVGCTSIMPPAPIKPTIVPVNTNKSTNVSIDSNASVPLTQTHLIKTINFFKNLEVNATAASSKPEFYKLSDLNDFFNANFSYKKDDIVYGKNDYWASVYEMIQSGFVGDCEDYTFGKIQLAELYGVDKKNINVGYTAKGAHIFVLFNDGKRLVVSDTSGKLKKFEAYQELYPDMKIYSYEDLWITKDSLISKKRGEKILFKVIGNQN